MSREIIHNCACCKYVDAPSDIYPCVICSNRYPNKFKRGEPETIESIEKELRIEKVIELSVLAEQCSDYMLLDLICKLLQKSIASTEEGVKE